MEILKGHVVSQKRRYTASGKWIKLEIGGTIAKHGKIMIQDKFPGIKDAKKEVQGKINALDVEKNNLKRYQKKINKKESLSEYKKIVERIRVIDKQKEDLKEKRDHILEGKIIRIIIE